MQGRHFRLIPALAVGFILAMAGQASAAATLTVDDDGDQCPLFDYATVQAAIDAASSGDTIHICGGLYTEQVTDPGKDLLFDGDGPNAATIRAPASLDPGPCDSSSPNRPVLCINGGATVTVQDLTVDGDGKGNANDRIVGIAYRNAGGTVQNTNIVDVRNTPFDAIQSGVGVLFSNADAVSRGATLTGNTLRRFQTNGILLDGANLTATVTGNTVEGVGPQDKNAQNGVQLSGGTTGTVSGNTISDIAYTPDTLCSTGILLDGTGAGVQVNNNTLTDIHCGIYATGGPAVQITGNTLTRSHYSVTLQDTPATVNGNTMSGGPQGDFPLDNSKGISAAEFTGGADFTVTANENTLTDYHDAALLLADRDSLVPEADDPFDASMTAHFNRIAGNPGDGARNEAGGSLDVEDNWWGCDEGPASPPDCDPATSIGGGTIDFDPWLVLGLSASPTSIATGGATSIATADLTLNSDGDNVGPGFPAGTSLAFATTLGSIQTPRLTTAAGMATSTLTSGGTAGTANVTASLDNETVATPVIFTGGAASGSGATPGPAQVAVAGAKAKRCKKIKNKIKRRKCRLKLGQKKPA